MDYDPIIYMDELETRSFRQSDFTQLIKAHYQLSIYAIRCLGSFDSPHWSDDPSKNPQRAWFFEVVFDTPEGKKGAECEIGLAQDQTLTLHFAPRPSHLIFNEHDRQRAKEEIPDLTLDYIKQLEHAGQMAWQVWKEVIDSVRLSSDRPLADFQREFHQVLAHFFEEYEKVGLLLPDGNTPLTTPEGEEKRENYRGTGHAPWWFPEP